MNLESPLVKFGVDGALAEKVWPAPKLNVVDNSVEFQNVSISYLAPLEARKLEEVVVSMNIAERKGEPVNLEHKKLFQEIMNSVRGDVSVSAGGVKKVVERRQASAENGRRGNESISRLGQIAIQPGLIAV